MQLELKTVIIFSLALLLLGCRRSSVGEGSCDQGVEKKILVEQIKFFPSEAEINDIVKKGMSKKDIENMLGGLYSISFFEGYDKMNYIFDDGLEPVPEEGAIIGISVYLKNDTVEKWKPTYQGGIYRHDEHGIYQKINAK